MFVHTHIAILIREHEKHIYSKGHEPGEEGLPSGKILHGGILPGKEERFADFDLLIKSV